MFIDYAKIRLRAGNGGAGIVAFHREKYIDKGGPSGGNGGRGGNIIFSTNPNLHTLQDIRYRRLYKAENGNLVAQISEQVNPEKILLFKYLVEPSLRI